MKKEAPETDRTTGEVLDTFSGQSDVAEVRKFRAVPNQRAKSDNAPGWLILVGRKEMGAMWYEGQDRRDRPYYKLKLNGYPMPRAIWLRAFEEDDGTYNLDYSAPEPTRPAASDQEAA